jgi:DNA-binding NarL/FixJ family response regulator
MTGSLRVGVVEDHPLFRRALERLVLAQGWTLAFACEDLESARAALRSSGADVVVLDLQLPDGSGLELIDSVGPPFLVVSSWDDVATVKEVERAGGRGLVSKAAEDGAIAAAIRDVVSGRTAFAPPKASTSTGTAGASSVLTGRELECLVLVAEGLSNREIADVLGIGTETVKSHVGAILQKLMAKDRAQAVAFAVRRGLI